jgi:hypothetical protein
VQRKVTLLYKANLAKLTCKNYERLHKKADLKNYSEEQNAQRTKSERVPLKGQTITVS